MATIKLRTGTTALWTKANPVLALGEPGYDSESQVLKVGDGSTPWMSLRGYLNETTLASVYASLTRTALNLKDFGAAGDGIANDTTAVAAWLDAVRLDRAGYAPKGTYLVDCDTIDVTLSGATLIGDGDRRTVFKARTQGTRLFDLRQTGTSVIERMAFDGDNKARTNLDLGNTTIGASTGNKLTDVRVLNQLDRGIDLTNNGDTVLTRPNGGPWPDSATGIYWLNSGGNNLVHDPKLFPTAANPGPARATIEASFQNMMIVGGALMGLRILDNQASQTLWVPGVQFYPIRDGGNVTAPKTGSGLYSLVADGATKFAVHAASQCYFDGWFQFLISARGCTFNSGATDGIPNAFGPNFRGSNGTEKLRLLIEGSVLRNETGASPATWNDTIHANVEVDYQNFFGATHRNYKQVVRAGTGASGHGLQVGGGSVIRQILSSPLAPATWANDQTIGANSYISTTTTMSGTTAGNGLIVEPSIPLPAGVQVTARIAGANSVRLEVYNANGSSYTLPGGTTYRVYALLL